MISPLHPSSHAPPHPSTLAPLHRKGAEEQGSDGVEVGNESDFISDCGFRIAD
jgi:hypothetical protein